MKNVHNNQPGQSPGKLKKQNASNGRKTHTPAKPDKNETQWGAVSRLRTPYLAYFTSTLPKCQGRKRSILYDLPRIPPVKPLVDKTTASWYNKSLRGHGGIGRLGGFRFHCESVQVRVLLPAPNQYNPNQIFPVGDGFGLFVFFGRFEETHFRNGVVKRAESKSRGVRK